MTARAVPVQRLLALLYFVGLIMLLDQVAEVAANLLAQPVTPGSASWRFGLFGMAVSRASILLIADILLFIAAVGLEHRITLRVLALVHFLLVATLGAGLVLFLLDALQVQGMVRPTGKLAFVAASARAIVTVVLGMALAAWTGVVAWASSRSPSHRGRSDGGALLVRVSQKDER